MFSSDQKVLKTSCWLEVLTQSNGMRILVSCFSPQALVVLGTEHIRQMENFPTTRRTLSCGRARVLISFVMWKQI